MDMLSIQPKTKDQMAYTKNVSQPKECTLTWKGGDTTQVDPRRP